MQCQGLEADIRQQQELYQDRVDQELRDQSKRMLEQGKQLLQTQAAQVSQAVASKQLGQAVGESHQASYNRDLVLEKALQGIQAELEGLRDQQVDDNSHAAIRIRRLEQYFDTTNSDMTKLGQRVDTMLSNLSKVTDSMTALAGLQSTTRGPRDGEEGRGRPPTRESAGGKGKGPARVPTNHRDPGNQAGPSQARIHGGVL